MLLAQIRLQDQAKTSRRSMKIPWWDGGVMMVRSSIFSPAICRFRTLHRKLDRHPRGPHPKQGMESSESSRLDLYPIMPCAEVDRAILGKKKLNPAVRAKLKKQKKATMFD